MKRIYADYAATTPTDPDVVKEMLPWFTNDFENPSSLHSGGRKCRRAIEKARKTVERILGCEEDSVIFTGSGTEADNMAMLSAAENNPEKKHILISAVEHHAVKECGEVLRRKGYEVSYIPCDEEGTVHPETVLPMMRNDTALVAVMLANNEVGTIEPIEEISKVVHGFHSLLLCDAVQAVGHIPVNCKELGCDYLTFSSHKFYGPKGVGGIYVRPGVPIVPLLRGGGQEGGLRSGTENVPGIVGMAKALEIANDNLTNERNRVKHLSERLLQKLERLPDVYLNGSRDNRLPGNINLSFLGVSGEALLHLTDMAGIEISTGAACNSNRTVFSEVLTAMKVSEKRMDGAIRISIGRMTTEEEADTIASRITDGVQKIRMLAENNSCIK